MKSIFILLAAVLLFTVNAHALENVAIASSNDSRVVRTPNYEAVIAADGSMTSLKVRGEEFLNASVSISRGTYFYLDGALKLPNIEQSESTITAKGENASIQYEFTPDALILTVASLSDRPMPFFIILDAPVNVMANEKSEFAKAPVQQDGVSANTWFRGKSKLAALGCSRLWPWEGGTQVWEASLGPKETRKITLRTGAASDAELKKISEIGVEQAAVDADLAIVSPRNYQVVQRQTRLQGRIVVSGHVKPECDRVEVKISGAPLEGNLPDTWQALPYNLKTRSFYSELNVPAGGWYKLELRAAKAAQAVATASIEKFGVGEVFVGAGQSNSTNCGQEKTSQTSGMVSSFSGNDWRLANDPQPGCHDNSGGGSFWPSFGDAMYEKYKVPIGVAATGHGGTSVNAWQPKGELFNWMMTRIDQLGHGGFRAVLWHQGESDVGMSAADYAGRLTSVIRSSTAAAGWEFPWFVAQVSYHNPKESSFPSTRDAQKKLWESGIALEGPDTDTLGGDNRDNGGTGIHFSPKGLRAHGKMWTEKIGVYLDEVLGK